MAPTSKPTPPSSSLIHATSQQTRFKDTGNTLEVDLKDVTISIGEVELLSSVHLRLKEGVRYGLVGRNGTGKSTLCTAIADKLIPGLSPSLRILLLSQVEDATRASEDKLDGKGVSVLEHVVRGDKARESAVEEMEVLIKAVESTSLAETWRTVLTLRLEKRVSELLEAQKMSSRRSGTRGKEARMAEIEAEKKVQEAEEALVSVGSEEIDAGIVSEAMEMLQDVQVTLDLLETTTTDARAGTILSGLGFSQAMMDSPYGSLSGGWRSRCSLATSLLVQSDILLLDEPSNFLDLEATIWLETYLSSEPRTLVLISHDIEFLDNVVEETIVLRKKGLRYFEGTPSAFEVNERKERRRLLKDKGALDKKKDHIEKSIQQGIASAKKTGDENRQRMVKSRQKKLDDRFGIETSAKGTRFKLNRDLAGYHNSRKIELVMEDAESNVKIRLSDPPKLRTLGDLIHFDNVSYRFPKAKTALLEDVVFTVEQGGRCAFVGANGQGKSTLAKLIMGTLKPTTGSITRHPLLTIGYFSQHSVEELTIPIVGAKSVPTALSYFMNHFGDEVPEQDARACLGSFGLQGKVASDTPLTQLSGGQKVRLAFSLVVFKPPALLLLDELTTHVDAPTIQALALALKTYAGGIVLITHDRWSSRVVIEGESHRPSAPDESSDDDSSDEEEGRRGKTYKVGGGKVKQLEKGMGGYVAFVERKLERERKKRELELAANV